MKSVEIFTFTQIELKDSVLDIIIQRQLSDEFIF